MLDLLNSIRQVALRGSVATAEVTFYDGEPVDPGAVTVTVTNDAGAIIATGDADGTADGPRTFTLDQAATRRLNRLTVEWTSTRYGVLTTYMEVVGGVLCGIGQIDVELNRGGTDRDLPAAGYEEAQKLRARTVASDALEQECGVAFSPRYRRDRFDGVCGDELMLPTPNVLAVQSIVKDGVAWTTELAGVEVTRWGSLFRAAGWPGGRRVYDIAWEHGYRSTPGDVSRAVAMLAASVLTDGPWDDRGYGVVDEGGFARLLTAGVQGASFSIPEVQAVVARYPHPVAAP